MNHSQPIGEATIEELEAMLHLKKRRARQQRPAIIGSGASQVIDACEKYITAIIVGEEDTWYEEQLIFQVAMKTIYGDEIFDWVEGMQR